MNNRCMFYLFVYELLQSIELYDCFKRISQLMQSDL